METEPRQLMGFGCVVVVKKKSSREREPLITRDGVNQLLAHGFFCLEGRQFEKVHAR